MMCISDQNATQSVHFLKRQLQRSYSWPLCVSDVVKLTCTEVNNLKDTIADINISLRYKSDKSTDVSKLNYSTVSKRERMKNKCLNTYTVPSKISDTYLQDWFRSQKTTQTINDIPLYIEKQKEWIAKHISKHLFCKENDGIRLSFDNIFEKKTKSTCKSGSLDFLFNLQWVPQLTYNVFPSSLESYFESLSSGNTVGVSESMSNNLLRLSSFSTFPPHINIFSSHFSSAGFYFTGHSDTVKCYSCGITHSNWTTGDNPIEIHKRLNPNCPHLQNYCYQNNALTSVLPSNCASGHSPELELSAKRDLKNSGYNNQNSESMTSQKNLKTYVSKEMKSALSGSSTASYIQENAQFNSIDNLSEANRETRIPNYIGTNTSQNSTFQTEYGANNSITENNEPRQNIETNEAPSSLNTCEHTVRNSSLSVGASNKENPEGNVPNLGVNLERPKYPNYAPLQVRISTYQNWPGYLDQTPKLMATAGFLYAGYNDYTRCFFCGGGLRNWEAGDDPWIEHARWFPKCAYLLQNKGANFIKVVQEKHKQGLVEGNNLTNQDNVLTVQTTVNANECGTPEAITESQQISQNPLDTIAARSVLEMGYTNIQVLQAIEKLRNLKTDEKSATATEIMTVLLDDNFDWNITSSNTTQTPQHIVATCNSAHKYTLNSSVEKTPIATSNTNSIIRGASVAMSSNELATNLDDSEHLLEENRQLRDQRLCKVCLDLEASIAFLPCGHLVCCADCALAMRKCPICRARVKGTVKTFLV